MTSPLSGAGGLNFSPHTSRPAVRGVIQKKFGWTVDLPHCDEGSIKAIRSGYPPSFVQASRRELGRTQDTQKKITSFLSVPTTHTLPSLNVRKLGESRLCPWPLRARGAAGLAQSGRSANSGYILNALCSVPLRYVEGCHR